MEEIDIDVDVSWPGTVPALQQIKHLLIRLHEKVDTVMSQQDDLNTLGQTIEGDVAAINQGVANVQSEIAALQQASNANQPLDFTAVNQAVSDLATSTQGVTDAGNQVPPVTPPAPTPAPGA